MVDREKVVKGLKHCRGDDCNGDKWYKCEYSGHGCIDALLEDALALLKAQEPVAPIPTLDDDWVCGNCGESVVGYTELESGGFEDVRHNFCPNCGRAVKWE